MIRGRSEIHKYAIPGIQEAVLGRKKTHYFETTTVLSCPYLPLPLPLPQVVSGPDHGGNEVPEVDTNQDPRVVL